MSGGSRVFHFSELPVVSRGVGVRTTPLVGKSFGDVHFSTGVTSFPPGAGIPLHHHQDCDEQVMVLEGEAEAEVDGTTHRLGPFDGTFAPAGVKHRFTNVGAGRMSILWIYNSTKVTRTFAETGETVEHLSAGDTATARG